jgi:hypothetical protein
MGRKYFIFLSLFIPQLLTAADVLQYHLDGARTGLFVDPAITQATAAKLHIDPTFNAPILGNTYAQPLYVTKGPNGNAALITATEQNVVSAISAADGSALWARNLGAPVPLQSLPCGNINPLGATGTPVIDATARIVYVAAMTTPDNGVTKQQRIFALSLDDGSLMPGWPVDVSKVSYNGTFFDSTVQNQRGALLLQSGTLYVPYGGHFGDCGNYHGWVVAVPVGDPTKITAWATTAPRQGGTWAPGGLSTDGNFVFVATGNTGETDTWMGGEAIIRLGAGATFSGTATDFFTPSNWHALDLADLDVGGSGSLVIDVPGATPSQLVVALGKNGVAYLLDRSHLGGTGTGNGVTGEGLVSKLVSDGRIIDAPTSFTAASGTYVVFTTAGNGVGCPGIPGNLVALKIGATSPPTISVAWCADNGGKGSPISTSIDGTSQPIVWSVGAEMTNRLQGFNGETGQLIFAGGGPAEQMGSVHRYQTPIVANGRIFVAGDTALYAFTVH